MDSNKLYKLHKKIVSFPTENEWIEFKIDNSNPEIIGEKISAL